MSTSLLYHGFGVYGYDYVCQKFIGGMIFITIKAKENLIMFENDVVLDGSQTQHTTFICIYL